MQRLLSGESERGGGAAMNDAGRRSLGCYTVTPAAPDDKAPAPPMAMQYTGGGAKRRQAALTNLPAHEYIRRTSEEEYFRLGKRRKFYNCVTQRSF
ncbi:hypothetical protein NDU88_002927 [Pleurodeles waltl]|uniref:Uncharacterized protein n=1 Tax=Pleurodeles waltl TaxID=8319 RepID=A0AAV7W474_PLEWA|nr:hypothetical protein NDU88_002927 [Pleurodeles waltl]